MSVTNRGWRPSGALLKRILPQSRNLSPLPPFLLWCPGRFSKLTERDCCFFWSLWCWTAAWRPPLHRSKEKQHFLWRVGHVRGALHTCPCSGQLTVQGDEVKASWNGNLFVFPKEKHPCQHQCHPISVPRVLDSGTDPNGMTSQVRVLTTFPNAGVERLGVS